MRGRVCRGAAHTVVILKRWVFVCRGRKFGKVLRAGAASSCLGNLQLQVGSGEGSHSLQQPEMNGLRCLGRGLHRCRTSCFKARHRRPV